MVTMKKKQKNRFRQFQLISLCIIHPRFLFSAAVTHFFPHTHTANVTIKSTRPGSHWCPVFLRNDFKGKAEVCIHG